MERLYPLRELFEKYLQGTASAAEKAALREALDQFTNEELVDVLEPIVASTQRDRSFRLEDWEPAIRAILRHEEDVPEEEVLEEETPEGMLVEERLAAPVRKLHFPERVRWWAAAAIITLLIAGGGYLYYTGSANGVKQRPVAIKQPILPGGDKALLTLADGSTIVLEKADNGQLAQQGTVKVIKLNNGLVSYASADKGAASGGSSGASGEGRYNILTVPRGGRYQVVLPDGSSVLLNSASSLRFPTAFTGPSRTVELTGEGYFEIKQDKAHPFSVKINGLEVGVLGTAFNVMAYDDEDAIQTTLVQGSVKLTSGAVSKQIAPGEQAALSPGNDRFTILKPDLQEVLAWKEGKFRFNDAKITSIMRQIARWYDVDIKYQGAIPSAEFNGVFLRKGNVSELLEVLELTKDVHFKIEGKEIAVIPGAR